MKNITHNKECPTFQARLEQIEQKIRQRGDLPYATIDEQLEIINQLAEFPLGRFLVERRGLNGYWTHYILTHGPQEDTYNTIEHFMLNKAPIILATQERYRIFKEEHQKRLRPGIKIASMPCGLMTDLFDLDWKGITDFQIYGFDIDPQSLILAEEYACRKGMESQVVFKCLDAWNPKTSSKFDLLTSNGLSIYVEDEERVAALYQQFANLLNPGGVLVSSYVTPPPRHSQSCEWNMDSINEEDLLRQKLLIVDLIDVKWQCYRSTDKTVQLLTAAGFSEINIRKDRAGIFPTVTAVKS